jgi:hypothetical protein
MKTFWLLLVAVASACATTGISPAQRQKASDCSATCDRDRPPPLPDRPADTRDTRSDCEKRCGM